MNFAEIQCRLEDPYLVGSPISGQCSTKKANWDDECLIACKAGYGVGKGLALDGKHNLKCVGTTVANAVWKQRDDPTADPPTCKSTISDKQT